MCIVLLAERRLVAHNPSLALQASMRGVLAELSQLLAVKK
jgi:hypothetical protein